MRRPEIALAMTSCWIRRRAFPDVVRFTAVEREFLDAACRQRDEAVAAETARGAELARLRRRARHTTFALGAAVAAIVAAVVVYVVVAGPSDLPRIAAIAPQDLTGNEQAAGYEEGFLRAERDFDLVVDRHDPELSGEAVIVDLAATETELVIVSGQDAPLVPSDLNRRSTTCCWTTRAAASPTSPM